MQKILWLFLSLAVILEARENPFETGMSPQTVGQTTQIKDERTDFTNTTITLLANAPKEEIPQGAKFDGVTCVDCGFEIEPARLISVPNTCRCGKVDNRINSNQIVI
jgi:RNA polymerase-binding transcription factor DksA